LTDSEKTSPIAMPITALMIAMVCFQLGATLAKSLFPLVGAGGTAALRIAIASLILLAVWRPWHLRFTPAQLRTVIVYGVAMGWMNYFFYSALSYIPLGVTMALEFTGPLGVALFASRRPVDFLWILLATLGLLALLPLGLGGQPLSLLGVAYALGAGVCWALYIVFGRRAGTAHGGQITALGTAIGAVMIVPIGYASSGTQLFSPSILRFCRTALLGRDAHGGAVGGYRQHRRGFRRQRGHARFDALIQRPIRAVTPYSVPAPASVMAVVRNFGCA
jgi:inner membrane transporter RhtA